MPVKHALLALLAERDLTGYELKIRRPLPIMIVSAIAFTQWVIRTTG